MSEFNYKNYEGFMDEEKDRSVLRSSSVLRTSSLFAETITYAMKKKDLLPLYTMRDVPFETYWAMDGQKHILPSAYRIYMNSVDETEAALKLVGSLSHWRKLIREHDENSDTNSKWFCPWFMEGKQTKPYEGLLQWRLDMEARDRMFAKRALQKKIEEEGNVTAARQFLDYGISEQRVVKSKGTTKPTGVNNIPHSADIEEDVRLLQKYKGAGNDG